MLVRYQERRFPARGLAFFLTLFLCLSGLWGMVELFDNLLAERPASTVMLAWGLGGDREGEERSLLKDTLVFLTGIDTSYPPGILEAGLPVAALDGAKTVTSGRIRETGEQQRLRSQVEVLPKKPEGYQVAIYHTHNAESYVPFSGKSKVEGKNGGVYLVGEELVKVLAGSGIRVVHDQTIHDYPDFPRSYIKSEPTAERLVRENPGLKLLIDLHRDAGVPKRETVKVNGQEVARIMLVVGNSRFLPNPHWRENYAFALDIANRLRERYPGVLKAVRVQEGRFNQHVFPHAVLVEVGSDKNTLAEAQGAARCLAEVLVEMLKEQD